MTSLWQAEADPIVSDGPPTEDDYDALVVGGGLTGLTTAVLLARAGLAVGVVEARHLGAATTGNTTAKLSLLQGSKLSAIRRHRSAVSVRSYVESNREGQQWLLRYCEEHGVGVQRRDAVSYANTPEGLSTLRDEFDACRAAGLAVQWVDELEELPFGTRRGIRLPEQAQFDPMDLLAALAADLRSRGGRIHEGVRVTRVRAGDRCTVRTTCGTLRAAQVVIATGIPVLDRGFHFATMAPMRSYCIAYEGVAAMPEAMYLAVDRPTRSLRTAPRADGRTLLIVGGEGHGVGRTSSPGEHLDRLRRWAARHFPEARETHWWSAQDYAPVDQVPSVGELPWADGVYVATGFDKWGMTNAAASALRLAAMILRDDDPVEAMGRRGAGVRAMAEGLRLNAEVGGLLTAGHASALLRTAPERPVEGSGRVGRGPGGRPTAVSTVDGRTCSVSAVCPHLGGVVTWNDAERSWDCPLHGSRFAPDGTLLEGPSTRGLAPRDG